SPRASKVISTGAISRAAYRRNVRSAGRRLPRSSTTSTGSAPRAAALVMRPTGGLLMSLAAIVRPRRAQRYGDRRRRNGELHAKLNPERLDARRRHRTCVRAELERKLEYLYVDLGTATNTVVVAGIPTVTDRARIQMNVMRAGVNY